MEAYYYDFVGAPIWYDSAAVSNETTEFSINVTTDIEYIRNCVASGEDAKNIQRRLGVILTHPVLTDYYINMNSCVIEAEVRFNADLSWGRLHDLFFPSWETVVNRLYE